MINGRVAYVLSGVIAFALIFQLFFRYQYEHASDGVVMRIDRVTGSSCVLPCLPPTPRPTPSPFDYTQAGQDYKRVSDDQDQQAILIAEGTAEAAHLVESEGSGYSWTAKTADLDGQIALDKIGKYRNAWATPDPKDTNIFDRVLMETPPPLSSASFQTKLVCYCDAKGIGWRWEVHTDTRAVYFVNDNADLMKKYGIK